MAAEFDERMTQRLKAFQLHHGLSGGGEGRRRGVRKIEHGHISSDYNRAPMELYVHFDRLRVGDHVDVVP